MTSTTHRGECSEAAPVLYVSFELGSKEWLLTLGVTLGGPRYRAKLRPGDAGQLRGVLAEARRRFGLAADVAVRSCYEAGRDGFWPARWLARQGVENLVVDSSSIEVPRRARRSKTDRLDGEKLLRMLMRYWSGDHDLWQVVRVPPTEAEDARHASRGLTTLQRERTRHRNRIHALLAQQGTGKVRIDARLPERLERVRDWAGQPLGEGLTQRILETWRVLRVVEEERRARWRAERQRVREARSRAAALAQRLSRLRGVAARAATILGDELFSRDLKNRREVGALSGYTSAPYASGETRHDQGLSRSGLPAVRRVGVQLAWAWLRYQRASALARWYRQRFGGGGPALRRVGIVALARRLMIALWRYLQTGVVPDGAMLKA